MGNRRRRKEGAELLLLLVVVAGAEGLPGLPGLLLAQVEFSQLTFRLANISVVITIEGSIRSLSPSLPLSLPLSFGQMMIEDDVDERESGRAKRAIEVSSPTDQHLFGVEND